MVLAMIKQCVKLSIDPTPARVVRSVGAGFDPRRASFSYKQIEHRLVIVNYKVYQKLIINSFKGDLKRSRLFPRLKI